MRLTDTDVATLMIGTQLMCSAYDTSGLSGEGFTVAPWGTVLLDGGDYFLNMGMEQ